MIENSLEQKEKVQAAAKQVVCFNLFGCSACSGTAEAVLHHKILGNGFSVLFLSKTMPTSAAVALLLCIVVFGGMFDVPSCLVAIVGVLCNVQSVEVSLSTSRYLCTPSECVFHCSEFWACLAK